MIENKFQDGQFKPSRRIILRKLTINIRYISILFLIGAQYLRRIREAIQDGDLGNFLPNIANSQNFWIIMFTGIILILAIGLILIVITNIGAIIYGYLNYLTMYNEITRDVIIIRRGIILKQRYEIPVHRITDIQIQILPFDRILKTADIQINTAGGRIHYTMETLYQEDAYEIHEFLMRQIRRINHSIDSNSLYPIFSDPKILAELKEIKRLMAEVL